MRMKQDKLNYIMEYALTQFKMRGFSKVTMDQIATATGTGKGTIYKYFPSKEDLLINSLKLFISKLELALNEKMNSNLNPIDKLENFINFISEVLRPLNTENLADIERNVPKAYRMINEAREKFVLENLRLILEEGKKKEFKEELDTTLVAHIIIGAAEHITKSDTIQKLPYDNMNMLFKSILKIVIEGCKKS